MKNIALVIAFLSPLIVSAKKREWISGYVAAISSDSSSVGFAVIPVGTAIAGVSLRTNRTFYRIETPGVAYVLVAINKRHPVNITLCGKTWLALDGNGKDAHLIDDSHRDVKLPIALKVATIPAASQAEHDAAVGQQCPPRARPH